MFLARQSVPARTCHDRMPKFHGNLVVLPAREPFFDKVKGDVKDDKDGVVTKNLAENVSVSSLRNRKGHNPVSSNPRLLPLNILSHQTEVVVLGGPVRCLTRVEH